jgi:hypothetical protein
MSNKNLYRLVKPYQSNKVYEALTIMHGAGKCYKELKKSNVNCDSFSIMDINLNAIYDFKLNQKEKMILNKDPSELLNQNQLIQNGGDDLLQIKNDIQQLKNRMNIIENKILSNV